MKLNDKLCKSLEPKRKPYKKSDGDGLFLMINPNGSKYWRFKYYFAGKEKVLSIGSYPIVSLSDAREERHKAKRLLSSNPSIDPQEDKKRQKLEAVRNAEETFEAVALEWYEYNKKHWGKLYTYKVLRCFELYVFPKIGSRPIKEITTAELLNECFDSLEKREIYEIIRRIRHLIGQVFRFAIQRDKCTNNPAENLKGAIRLKPGGHHRTIEPYEIPAFLNALERNEVRLYERTVRAVWLSLYTFQRPGEIRQARWSDINLKEGLWKIPKDLMKMNRDHIVPLSYQVIEILKKQKEEVSRMNTDWVFPSQPHPRYPMSDGTVNKALKRLKYGDKMVAHGFRALARTTIREKLKYDSEVIEKQLAHKTSNPLGEAYDRTQFIDERIQMMQDWADYLDSLKP